MTEIKKQQSPRSATKTNGVISGKCQRPSGPAFRNPYLNFLREFRQRNSGLAAVEIIRRGAKEWSDMTKENKLHYIEEAFYAPKKRKAAPQPSVLQQAQLRMVSTAPEDCGIVCPRMNACEKKKKRRRKSKCARRRRPKKRRCGKKRSSRRKRKRCKI